jgi:ATP-dependent Clp protease protease subunit
MAALLLAAGTTSKRSVLPHARVMIHQPSGGSQGQATTLEIYTKEILNIRVKLNEILAKHTKQNIKKISKDTDRDYFMSADEAKNYGIVDNILTSKSELKKK